MSARDYDEWFRQTYGIESARGGGIYGFRDMAKYTMQVFRRNPGKSQLSAYLWFAVDAGEITIQEVGRRVREFIQDERRFGTVVEHGLVPTRVAEMVIDKVAAEVHEELVGPVYAAVVWRGAVYRLAQGDWMTDATEPGYVGQLLRDGAVWQTSVGLNRKAIQADLNKSLNYAVEDGDDPSALRIVIKKTPLANLVHALIEAAQYGDFDMLPDPDEDPEYYVKRLRAGEVISW